MSNKKIEHCFWITNITKNDINIGDLRTTVKAYQSVNLLDSRHYSFTLEQLEESAKNGSLFKRGNVIKIRNVPPVVPVKPGPHLYKGTHTLRINRPIVSVEVPKYEELDFSDEKYAAEDLDAALDDNKPAISLKKSK